MRRLVHDRQDATRSCTRAVVCHNDFIDRPLLVEPSGEPHLIGVVDLERASWNDPLADLARTKLLAQYHDEVVAEVLVTAYGLSSAAEHRRLEVHEVLHALEERTWIGTDRPHGWKRSIVRLDGFRQAHT